MTHRDDSWSFGDVFAAGFGPKGWTFGSGPGRGRSRRQMFEAGEMKFVILRLIKEKPRHGYEVIKALEERLSGCYTASPGTVYPTLQLLEDQGFVRVVETEGKKVYHITPEGEAFLEEHKGTLDEIIDRVKEAVRGFSGGSMADLNETVSSLMKWSYKTAWRAGPDDEKTKRIVEILKRALAEVEGVGKT
jgi:DNA-binding PadR family transcriptional regulator